MTNLSSILVLLQLVLTLLSNPSTANSSQAQTLATQAIGYATQALESQATTSQSVAPQVLPTNSSAQINALTEQYNSQMSALNQQIVNIEAQYQNNLTAAESNSAGMAILEGTEQQLYSKEQQAIAAVQVQEQQLQINYQNQLNSLNAQNAVQAAPTTTPQLYCDSYSAGVCILWKESTTTIGTITTQATGQIPVNSNSNYGITQ
jgi:L-fucose mutarotase/ribose pyranase (RbsD/FucU family)